MKISIITVSYNSEKTISKTIESVYKQNYQDFEYIIIDGQSNDKTLDIIKQYKTIFKEKMIWVSEKDKGIYDAMNKGLKMASGEVVGLLNSDDFYTSRDILSTIYEIFSKEKNIDAIYGDVHYIDTNKSKRIIRYYSSKFFKRSLMRLGFMPAHPSFYIRKECLNKIGFYDISYKIAADFEFLLRAIYIHKIKTKYIKKDFVTMTIGGVSTSGLISHKQIMQEHIKALRSNHIYSNYFLLSLRYLYKIYEMILFTLTKILTKNINAK